jgi:hypothetical protein
MLIWLLYVRKSLSLSDDYHSHLPRIMYNHASLSHLTTFPAVMIKLHFATSLDTVFSEPAQ